MCLIKEVSSSDGLLIFYGPVNVVELGRELRNSVIVHCFLWEAVHALMGIVIISQLKLKADVSQVHANKHVNRILEEKYEGSSKHSYMIFCLKFTQNLNPNSSLCSFRTLHAKYSQASHYIKGEMLYLALGYNNTF